MKPTLQQLQSLDVSLSYASIMDALGDTPHKLKIAYIPSVTPTELECELDPKTIRPFGNPITCTKYENNNDPDAFEASLLLCCKGTFWQWIKNHLSSHLNVDVLSDIRWVWMGDEDGKDPFFESAAVATGMSTPKTRHFPFDYIVFRIYYPTKPTKQED